MISSLWFRRGYTLSEYLSSSWYIRIFNSLLWTQLINEMLCIRRMPFSSSWSWDDVSRLSFIIVVLSHVIIWWDISCHITMKDPTKIDLPFAHYSHVFLLLLVTIELYFLSYIPDMTSWTSVIIKAQCNSTPYLISRDITLLLFSLSWSTSYEAKVMISDLRKKEKLSEIRTLFLIKNFTIFKSVDP